MSEFFKAKDFASHVNWPERLADLTNAILLSRGKKFQLRYDICSDTYIASDHGVESATHQALFINIEPLAKPDTAESLLWEFVAENTAPYLDGRRSKRLDLVIDRAKALLGGE